MPTLLLLLVVFLFFGTFAYAGLRGAPWVPTWSRDVKRFLKLAEIRPGQKMYDLGCGDGRLMVAAGRAGASTTGFELALVPYLIAQLRFVFLRVPQKPRIVYKDFWKADLRDADLVYVFLTPGIVPKLKLKLEAELKKGTRVITYVWPMVGWEPIVIDTLDRAPTLFVYKM